MIALVFIIAWGVAQYGLLYRQTELSGWLLRDILTIPYWQMFYDLNRDTLIQAPPFYKLEEGACTNDPELFSNYTMLRCADENTNWIVDLLLIGYFLISNMLLSNLLIAIFAVTFQKIQGSAYLDYFNFGKQLSVA